MKHASVIAAAVLLAESLGAAFAEDGIDGVDPTAFNAAPSRCGATEYVTDALQVQVDPRIRLIGSNRRAAGLLPVYLNTHEAYYYDLRNYTRRMQDENTSVDDLPLAGHQSLTIDGPD